MSHAGNTHEELVLEWSRLRAEWQDSQNVWKDEVAFQFSKQFMSEWETDIPSYLSALETLEEELRAAQRELS